MSHSEEGSLDAVSDFMRRNPGVTYVQEANKLPTLFAGKLDSQLPCVVTHSPRHFFYSGVMMDHRRIIGTVVSARVLRLFSWGVVATNVLSMISFRTLYLSSTHADVSSAKCGWQSGSRDSVLLLIP